jgi:hypothetical protein
MFTHRLLVAEVVMLFHQAVEQRLISSAPHLLEFDRADVVQLGFDRRLVQQDWRRARALRQWVVTFVGDRRQCDLTGSLQHQQEAAAHHVAQFAITLPPVPVLAQARRKLAAAVGRVLFDQRTYRMSPGWISRPRYRNVTIVR